MHAVINDFIAIAATHPVSKTLNWHTDLVRYDSGKEQRNQVRESPTKMWELGWSIMTTAQRNQAIELYGRAKGRFNTFQFRDPQEEDGISAQPTTGYTATSADNDTKTFVITSDVPEIFKDGVKFDITAGVNDGSWTCSGTPVSDGTNITVTVTIAPVTTAVDAPVRLQTYFMNHTYYDGEAESYTENRMELQHFSITAVSTVDETFTVTGAHTDQLEAGVLFIVTDSTGNDKNWVVDSVVRSGGNTVVTVTGNITNAVADGTIVILNVESNAVEMTPGVDYEVDEHAGTIEFLTNKAPVGGVDVTATYKYNYRVRFNSDFMPIIEFAHNKWEFQGVEIVEVKP